MAYATEYDKKKMITGWPSEVKADITDRLDKLARENDELYVGITSGEHNLKNRYNNKYKGLGYDKIQAIYEVNIYIWQWN